MNISAIVMASGLSRRMNENKLQLKINNKKIYEYILETIKNYGFYEKIVVAKDAEIMQAAFNLGFIAIENTKSYLGQSVSIKLALENSYNAEGYMFFVADQPFIKLSTIDTLCKTFEKNRKNIIVPSYNGINGNPVIFPFHLKEELMSITGDHGGKIVINNNLKDVIKVQIETENEFIDIDTIEDFEKVIAMNKKELLHNSR